MGPKQRRVRNTAKNEALDATATLSTKKTDDTPNWPPLFPLRDSSDLTIDFVFPNQIAVIEGLFTATLCKRYVSFLSSLPLQTTPGIPKRDEALRVNDRFQIEDPKFAKDLWEKTGLKSLVLEHLAGSVIVEGNNEGNNLWGGQVLGLNSNIRIYRYRQGQFFGQHYDESNKTTIRTDSGDALAKTTWTLLLYLTSCEGGETVFYPDSTVKAQEVGGQDLSPVSAGPRAGLALLHRHGDQCMLHEGKEVQSGEKWVIRSDLCVRR